MPQREELTFVPGARRRAEVRLRRAVDLDLHVVGEHGRPAPGTSIRIEPAGDDTLARHDVRADRAGRVALRLAAGAYTVTIRDRRELLDLSASSGAVRAVMTLD